MARDTVVIELNKNTKTPQNKFKRYKRGWSRKELLGEEVACRPPAQ